MFIAAQLGQDSIANRPIAQATARLSGDAQHPGVAATIRNSQDATDVLADLYRKRDQARAVSRNGSYLAGRSVADLEAQITEWQAKLHDADEALQAAFPRFDRVAQRLAPASDVLDLLHPREALVMITLSDLGGWVFLLRDNAVVVARITVAVTEVVALVKQICQGIELSADGILPEFPTAAAQSLYKLTLGEIAPSLNDIEAITVVPTGPLTALPFEVMLTEPTEQVNLSDAPWLVKKFTLTYLPDARSFVALRKFASRSHADRPWIGFGNPIIPTLAQAQHSFPGSACGDTARKFASLSVFPFGERELQAARQLLGADDSELVQGANFTADAVRHAELRRFRIIHFTTHFLLPQELRCLDDYSVITSAPPGASDIAGAVLTPSDVIGLDLDADLVVLSGCNTYAELDVQGRRLALVSAFFYAGAHSLMVSHWSVDDQTTAFLVADTFRRMVQNPHLGAAGALRDAQLGLLDVPAAAHPYFWAPLVILGAGRE